MSMNLKNTWEKKNVLFSSTLVCLIIGLCFLWTGSGYLTWMYHMMDFYPANWIDVLTEVVGYIFQILGLAIFAFLMKKKSALVTTQKAFLFTMLADFIFMVTAVLSPGSVSVLLFGYLMNIFHGLVAGFYLTELVIRIPQQDRGAVFGMGYGIGSIGSWILSLFGSGNFLSNAYVLFVYAILILVTMGLLGCLKSESTDSKEAFTATSEIKPVKYLLLLSAATVFLLSAAKNMGFYFPTADLTSGGVTLEFTRIFYAIGLVVAGFLNDKNRKYGAVLCLATLFFPFVMLLLRSDVVSSTILWVTAYVFFGFFAVYRVILFSDLAGKYPDYLYLAGFGLLWGRAGDVLGGFAGMCLKNQEVLLVLLVAVLFFFTVIIFFSLYHKTYYSALTAPEKSQEMTLQDFANRFQFSVRETDVFKLIMEGRSNGEIAADLYISENTVKFHIKNLLKKTQCTNRSELMALFRQ